MNHYHLKVCQPQEKLHCCGKYRFLSAIIWFWAHPPYIPSTLQNWWQSVPKIKWPHKCLGVHSISWTCYAFLYWVNIFWSITNNLLSQLCITKRTVMCILTLAYYHQCCGFYICEYLLQSFFGTFCITFSISVSFS
jgi:hypothetical protein